MEIGSNDQLMRISKREAKENTMKSIRLTSGKKFEYIVNLAVLGHIRAKYSKEIGTFDIRISVSQLFSSFLC